MTDREREQIRQAARAAAQSSRRAQGLPDQIVDARVVEHVATLLRGATEDRRAA